MEFVVLTLFPGMFDSPLAYSILKKARSDGLIDIKLVDIRTFARDKHRCVDDYPFGGGSGMVMKIEPIFEALNNIQRKEASRVILLTPQGKLFKQQIASELSNLEQVILICGRYEGVDHRVSEHLADMELSIGDYILTGGELPALVVIDAVTRLLPGVLDEEALGEESFQEGLLEYPQYTRPEEYRGWRVPGVLLSGHHEKISQWRKEMALKRTRENRPDLLKEEKED